MNRPSIIFVLPDMTENEHTKIMRVFFDYMIQKEFIH